MKGHTCLNKPATKSCIFVYVYVTFYGPPRTTRLKQFFLKYIFIFFFFAPIRLLKVINLLAKKKKKNLPILS